MLSRLTRRASLGVAVAALGVGAVLTGSSPAFAVEGTWSTSAGPCAATQKIELHYNPGDGRYHDFQAIDPTQNDASDPYYCEFRLVDNGSVIYSSNSGAQSPWYYDGPGHSMTACVGYYYNGQQRSYHCTGVYN
ncbi:hypothetical protein [Kitasatospora azatica]|uniref:hypothetical protein n=1 Tax=Kitasatospora azatica TaxID=58347 RepID=UPI000B22AC19|nr:hypothetical protein [Kitasatospora azatica]